MLRCALAWCLLACAVLAWPQGEPASSPSASAAVPAAGRLHHGGGFIHRRRVGGPPLRPSADSLDAAFPPPAAGTDLSYYGGRVVSAIQVVQVLWGSGGFDPALNGSSSPGIADFYAGILASPFTDWLTEYNTQGIIGVGGQTSNQTIGRGGFLGRFVIAPSMANAGTLVTDAQVANELSLQIGAGNLPPPAVDAGGNPLTYYAVFFPAGIVIELSPGSDSCSVFCAYHSTADTNAGELYYGVHPDMVAPSACSTGCGPSGATSFETVQGVASHELLETITDAETGLAANVTAPLAWYDANTDASGNQYGEVGDLCNGLTTAIIGGYSGTQVVQRIYSNQQSGCVVGPPATVVAGGKHSCALTSTGSVWCWGSNQYGQLGNGSTADSAVPVPVAGLPTGVLAITAGTDFTCALTSAGGVMCWGHNAAGQLGNGTNQDSNAPVAVSGLTSGAFAISAGSGGSHACALMSSGGVECWGLNTAGQLGNHSTTNANAPVLVSGLSGAAVALAAGAAHTCAVGAPLSSGLQNVACWGSNQHGQLGNGSNTSSSVPVVVTAYFGFDMLASGDNHSCAVVQDDVYCWGANGSGQLGNGGTSDVNRPQQVTGLPAGRVTRVALGGSHSCALDLSAQAWCWGANGSGQLGIGSLMPTSTPTAITSLTGMVDISAGTAHTCATTGLGGALPACWGADDSGQLGDNETQLSGAPVMVASLQLFPGSQAQTITFASLPNRALALGAFTLAPSSSSGLAVTLGSLTPSVCRVTGLTVTPLAGGVCSLQASQAGTPGILPALPVTQSFEVQIAQTISFPALPILVVGQQATLTATASSGLPVSFVSATPATCTISGSTVTVLASGLCTVTAQQGGGGAYAAASVSQSASVYANPTPQRSYVSAHGSDTASCGAVAPCRTLQAALAQVIPGGEVLVLDSGGYGLASGSALINITQAVTITVPPGIYAGVSPPAGFDGVLINAPGAEVTLRGLTITSQSSTAGSAGGDGIRVLAAASVHIEGGTIQGMPNVGISTRDATAAVFLAVRDSTLTGNGAGLSIGSSGSGASAKTAVLEGLTIDGGSVIPNGSGIGLELTDGAQVVLSASSVSGYRYGISATDSGVAPIQLTASNDTLTNQDSDLLLLAGAAGVNVHADIRHCVLTGTSPVNGTSITYGAAVAVRGITGGTGQEAAVSLNASQVSQNAIGVWLDPTHGGVARSYGNNRISGNATNTVGSLTVTPGQ